MFSRIILGRLTLTILLFGVQILSAYAQRIDDGQVAFDEKARPTRLLRQQLFKGQVQYDPKDKQHQEAVEMAAKEIIYPLIWKTMATRPKIGEINGLVDELDGRLVQMTRFKATTMAMQQEFCKQAIDRVAEVIQHDRAKPIAMVNAACMLLRISERRVPRDVPQTMKEWTDDVLPRLAEGNAEQLATTCIKLLESPKINDGTRYYLYRTLASLVELPTQSPPLLKPETTEKIYTLALKQVDKQMVFPKATPRTEVEGYKVLRLQAIKILTFAATPVVAGKERIALSLARVAGNSEEIVPAPRLEERVEASIGLARMAPVAAKFSDFQFDYAMAQINRTIEDLGNQANSNIDSKSPTRKYPWKVMGARLGEALDIVKANVKAPFVLESVDQCQKQVLAALERGAQCAPNILGDWISKNSPQSKSLFRGDDTTAIK